MEDRVQDNFTNRSDESLESLKQPQQEIGGQKISTDSELLRTILDNPEVLAVLHQKFKELEKPKGLSNWKKPLHVVVGFIQFLRARAISPSSLKAVLLFFWTNVLLVYVPLFPKTPARPSVTNPERFSTGLILPFTHKWTIPK